MSEIEAALTACDVEPIHVPGSIQPHGVMLVADRDGGRVRHVAGPVESLLGVEDWRNAGLDAILGAGLAATAVEAARGPRSQPGLAGQLRAADGRLLDAVAHRSGSWLVVELEPASEALSSPAMLLARMDAAEQLFADAPSVAALCDRAAILFREFTGFDRVMVYRFGEDDAGRVLAESKAPELHGFLNHHFPASDIPRQARALYVRNRVRAIPDITYRPAPLRPEWEEGVPLDMSDGALRSVSPVHLQYLRNMGVGASASVSVVRDGVLWGLIACHHREARLLPFDVRLSCQVLAGALARQIAVREEAEGYRQRIRLRAIEDDFLGRLAREAASDGALGEHLEALRRLVDADGICELREDRLRAEGVCPPAAELRALGRWLTESSDDSLLATARLDRNYAPAEHFRETGSGLLATVLSREEPWILMWFRSEQIEVLNWAGNPHKAVEAEPGATLQPRRSFEDWKETVRGQARRWTLPEMESARRLRGALLELQQNRRLLELNTRLAETIGEKDRLLEQKDFLMGEVNHRVQNSLQLVSAFLDLQRRGAASPEVKATLEEARRRLSAVALVHRRLYRDDNIRAVDLGRYVEELCSDSVTSMGEEWGKHLSVSLVPVLMPTDRAVTLGIVLTELLINVNKYAYGGRPGPIEIRMSEDGKRLRLAVADRGVGKAGDRKGFGSRMMDGFIAQLGGKLDYENNDPGLRAVVTVPIGG
ncbi:MAG: GAF domain-containing protein [Gluconacetobacter diazotrophicus]|nr:GAF domain-containing protein [Gluconacetobacter diazotrophicus]